MREISNIVLVAISDLITKQNESLHQSRGIRKAEGYGLRRHGSAAAVVDGMCGALGEVEAQAAGHAGPERHLREEAHLPLRAHVTGEVELRHPFPESVTHGPLPGGVQA